METANERLGQIPTLWTLVRRANNGPEQAVQIAQNEILVRYGGAVRRYLIGALRDEDAAEELFQDFALRFVRGDLRRADPERGRFRDFLKGVLSHMVTDYHNRRKRNVHLQNAGSEPATESTPGDEADRAFTESWREELLGRAWKSLSDLEMNTGQPYFTVLRFRADHPEMRSHELADALSLSAGKTMTAPGVRQILHRAREKFADALLDDVAQSLEGGTAAQLQDELTELGLLAYCQTALERRLNVSRE